MITISWGERSGELGMRESACSANERAKTDSPDKKVKVSYTGAETK